MFLYLEALYFCFSLVFVQALLEEVVYILYQRQCSFTLIKLYFKAENKISGCFIYTQFCFSLIQSHMTVIHI